jgi:cyclopropane-fatty-acyl-phospholipid synthase
MTISATELQRPSPSFFARLLRLVAGNIRHGLILVSLPDGEHMTLGDNGPGPGAELRIHSWRLLPRIAAGWDIGFAQSYLAGEWSSPDLTALMSVLCRNDETGSRLRNICMPPLIARIRHALNKNSPRNSRRNIAAHYDLGNAFYSQWLDAEMQYSSALFTREGQSLEDAQNAKLERIAGLLDLSGGESVLEIGCGWGSLARYLAEQHRCQVTGITLSTEQLEFARAQAAGSAVSEFCDFGLLDYRSSVGVYDRIVSIEMIEAVGESFWSLYFDVLRQRLRPGGTAVIQAITIHERRFTRYRDRPDYIQRFIFPGGMLPTSEAIARLAARSGLTIRHTEMFGASYARTLSEWSNRFQQAWPSIRSLGFDDRFRRMWDYYLSYCQAGFENGELDVGLYQMSAPS